MNVIEQVRQHDAYHAEDATRECGEQCEFEPSGGTDLRGAYDVIDVSGAFSGEEITFTAKRSGVITYDPLRPGCILLVYDDPVPAAESLPGAPRFVIDERPDATAVDVAAAEVLRKEMQSQINALWSTPNPTLCPLRVQSSLEAYVRGLPPGDFIRAVLSNDLNEAISRADDVNIHALPHIVAYVREHMPPDSWGGVPKVAKWLAARRKERDAITAKSPAGMAEFDFNATHDKPEREG